VSFKGWFAVLIASLMIVHFYWLRAPVRTTDPQPRAALRNISK